VAAVTTSRRPHIPPNASIDVKKYENEGSLIIMDSLKGHFDFGSDDPAAFAKQLVKRAESLDKKNGVSIIDDAGSFFHLKKLDKLIEHEMSMPSKFDINLKRFCVRAC
jgi:hypothetical protein